MAEYLAKLHHFIKLISLQNLKHCKKMDILLGYYNFYTLMAFFKSASVHVSSLLFYYLKPKTVMYSNSIKSLSNFNNYQYVIMSTLDTKDNFEGYSKLLLVASDVFICIT